jgi:hypothetical protein
MQRMPGSRLVGQDASCAARSSPSCSTPTSPGEPQALTVGTVEADGQWSPAPALPITVNRYEMTVSFRFTALGEGDWTIDDVYVDPYKKGRPAL